MARATRCGASRCEAVAQRMRAIDPTARVQCAYLELMQPDLPTAVHACVADGCDEIVVVPMFLGVGRHARQDLPALVAELNAAYPRHPRYGCGRPSAKTRGHLAGPIWAERWRSHGTVRQA